jgi:starvation-inducible DNA-binding protein
LLIDDNSMRGDAKTGSPSTPPIPQNQKIDETDDLHRRILCASRSAAAARAALLNPREKIMADDINIGLEQNARERVSAGLSKLLADTYAVYLKTHGYHWNVRGPNFGALHALLLEQYTEVWTAVDTVAERIRALGAFAPQGYRTFANLSGVQDGNPDQAWEAMLQELIADHEALIAGAREARAAAEDVTDDATTSLIDDRVLAHEKHAWMLRASLGRR